MCTWQVKQSGASDAYESLVGAPFRIFIPSLFLNLSTSFAQDKVGGSVVFCQNGSTSVRCVQLAAHAAAKGGKDKPGGQLKSDTKKPILALAANHTERHLLLLLYADGTLACCMCSPSTRTMSTRWTLPLEVSRLNIAQVPLLCLAALYNIYWLVEGFHL